MSNNKNGANNQKKKESNAALITIVVVLIVALVAVAVVLISRLNISGETSGEKEVVQEVKKPEEKPAEPEEPQEPEVKVLTAVDFLGMTVAEAEEHLGARNNMDYWQGSLSITYENQPYVIYVEPTYDEGDDHPEDREVYAVNVLEGGYVCQGITVGMTKDEIDAVLGYQLEISVNEAGSTAYTAGFVLGEYYAILAFDNKMVLEIALVKPKD